MVMKNAIMMVDFALRRNGTGLDAKEAIRQAARLRVRPITMTMLAAVFSAVPIASGLGRDMSCASRSASRHRRWPHRGAAIHSLHDARDLAGSWTIAALTKRRRPRDPSPQTGAINDVSGNQSC
jgi:hypothetical protein